MKKKKKNESSILKKLLYKSIICMILFLLFLICNKKYQTFNNLFYDKIYNNNISFAKINNWYKSHFGSILPIKKVDDVLVFNESITYDSKEDYLDGVVLNVSDNYLVPVINDGIIVFIGEKEYGNTVIVQDDTGLEIWYSNINIGNITIYDYVKKGDYLGEVKDNKLIMVFKKDGEVEDYNKYI